MPAGVAHIEVHGHRHAGDAGVLERHRVEIDIGGRDRDRRERDGDLDVARSAQATGTTLPENSVHFQYVTGVP